MILRRITLVLVATTVAALGFWLGQGAEERLDRFLPPAPDAPELYMERFSSLLTDAEGRPHYRLSGQRMEQYQGDGSSQVEAPIMVVHRETGPPWTVVSEHGWISPDGDEIHLLGAVHLSRPEGADGPPVDIHTRDVRVWPQPRQADTEAAVAVRSPLYQLDGTGMRIDLETSVLELLDDTDGTYFP